MVNEIGFYKEGIVFEFNKKAAAQTTAASARWKVYLLPALCILPFGPVPSHIPVPLPVPGP